MEFFYSPHERLTSLSLRFHVGAGKKPQDMEMKFLDILPKDFSEMTYNDILHIKMQYDPIRHWEDLTGVFSVMNGELLRFLLHAKIPLEKLIRHELASRGYDENHHWVSFNKASKYLVYI